MVKKLFFLLFFFLLQLLIAQETVKKIEGVIVNENNDVSGVHILNISSDKATITNLNGHFSIPAKLNDTLVFSAVQFKKETIVVSEIIMALNVLTVELETIVMELDEVILNKSTLVTSKSLGLPNADVKVLPQSERMLYDADHGEFVYYYAIGLSINVNKTLNKISGRTNMLKKRVARDQKYARSQAIRNSYADSIFTTDLKIPALKIEEFMLFCETDENFNNISKAKNDFIVWDFLTKKSIEFKKIKNLY